MSTGEKGEMMENPNVIVEQVEDYLPDKLETEEMDINEPTRRSQLIQTLQNDSQAQEQQENDLEEEVEEQQLENHEPNEIRAVVDNDINIKKKKYQCDICQAWLSRKSHLDRHILFKHTEEKKFKCDWPDCDRAFKQQIDLTIHERVHIGQDYYSCDVCDKSFTRPYTLTCHKRIHSGIGLLKCDLCDHSFTTTASLKSHKKFQHTKKEKKFKCDICEQSYITNFELLRHKKYHEKGIVYNCKYCDKTFVSPRDQIKHHRTHTGAPPPKCEICDKEFNQIRDLKKHKLRMHGIPMKIRTYKHAKCDVCDENISGGYRLLRRHKLRAHGIMNVRLPYKPGLECDICNETFSKRNRLRNLQRHKKRVHGIRSDNFVDSTATEEFTNLDNADHESSTRDSLVAYSSDKDEKEDAKQGETLFQCRICNTSFSSKEDLSVHKISSHSVTKDQTFKTPEVHENDIEISCSMELDDQSFVINLHLKSNSEEFKLKENTKSVGKAVEDYINNEVFKRVKNYLQQNEFLHTGEMPFLCGICNQYFPFQSDLNRHNESVKHKSAVEFNGKDEHLLKMEESTDFEAKFDIHIPHADNYAEELENVDIDMKHEHFIPEYETVKVENDSFEDDTNPCVDNDINPEEVINYKDQKGGKYADYYEEMDNSRIRCKLCDQTFKTINNFNKHVKIHTGPALHHCEICNKSYWRNEHFKVHKKSVMHARKLKEHQRIQLGQVNARQIKSNDKAFKKDVKLQLSNKFSNIVPLGDNLKKGSRRCHYCGARFSNSKALRKHEFIHTGKMPFYCDVCDQYFPFNSDFNKHKESLKHLNAVKSEGKDMLAVENGTFECTKCDLKFKNTRDRIKHEASQHTGIYPFTCDVCEQNFRFNCEFENHNKSQRHLKKVDYLSNVEDMNNVKEDSTEVNPLGDIKTENEESEDYKD